MIKAFFTRVCPCLVRSAGSEAGSNIVMVTFSATEEHWAVTESGLTASETIVSGLGLGVTGQGRAESTPEPVPGLMPADLACVGESSDVNNGTADWSVAAQFGDLTGEELWSWLLDSGLGGSFTDSEGEGGVEESEPLINIDIWTEPLNSGCDPELVMTEYNFVAMGQHQEGDETEVDGDE